MILSVGLQIETKTNRPVVDFGHYLGDGVNWTIGEWIDG